MMGSGIRAALPYAALLLVAGVLYFYADQIVYSARPGVLGPDFWPKAVIGVMAAMCLYQLIRPLWSSSASQTYGLGDELEAAETPAEDVEPEAPRFPVLLVAGSVLTIAYGVLIPVLGFVLSTFLYLIVFMYLGRYRAHAVIWLSSLLGTALLATIFLKVVYVSMPRGVPPFDQITDAFMRLF